MTNSRRSSWTNISRFGIGLDTQNPTEIRHEGKFGRSVAIGSGGFSDIWQQGGIISELTSAETMVIDSTGVGVDTAGGTGAQKIILEGLDDNYGEISEEIELDEASSPTTTKSYLRVNRMYVTDVGSGGVNANAITATATTAGSVQANIAALLGQTLKTQYTVPAGWDAYVARFYFNVGKGDDAELYIQAKNAANQSWRIQRDLQLFQNHISIELDEFLFCPSKGQIRMQGKAGTGTIQVSGGYDFYLVRS